MKKRLVIISVICLIATISLSGIALASDVFDALYTGTIRVTNNSTAETAVSVPFTASSADYIAGDYMYSSANNTAITNAAGVDVPYMPGYGDSNPWVVFVNLIGANTIQDNRLYMGGETDMDAKIRYFPGSNGMVVVDSPALELSDNFSIGLVGWFDADNGTGIFDFIKEGAFAIYPSATISGNRTASILSSATANLTPNAPGDYCTIAFETGAACPNHYQNVDDSPGAPDDATTMINTNSGVQEKDAYNCANATGIISSNSLINSVNVTFRCSVSSNATDATFQPYLRLNSIETTGTEVTANTTTWTNYTEELDRPGGGTWSLSDLDDLQVVIGLKQIDAQARCTQIYLQVNYSTPVASIAATNLSSGEHTLDIIYDVSANTTDICVGGVASASDAVAGGAASNAFDDNTATYWNINASSGWLQYDLGSGNDKVALKYTLIDRIGVHANAPLDWTFLGSNNGVDWTTLDTQTGIGGWVNEVAKIFTFSNSTSYRYYRIDITDNNGGAYTSIAEMEIMQPTFQIMVDGITEDASLDVTSVPDNSSNLQFFINNGMPYVESANITIDGALQASWEWEYNTIFTDLSGNGHVATPTFRSSSSDPDVSAELISFGPVIEAKAPGYSVNITTAGWITSNMTMSGNFTTTTNSTYPGSIIISDVTTAGNVPIQLLELILGGVIVLSLSLFISGLMRKNREGSLIVKILIIASGLGIFIAVGIIDNWILYLFLMISIALAMAASERQFTGTGNAGNNMIGFLAMAFVGMTTINRILEGRFIQAADVSILRDTLAFQPFAVFGVWTIPVPNTNFLTNGIPALMRWDYSFFGGNAQLFEYLLYSITAVISFMLFVLVFGAIYQMFSRGRI